MSLGVGGPFTEPLLKFGCGAILTNHVVDEFRFRFVSRQRGWCFVRELARFVQLSQTVLEKEDARFQINRNIDHSR
jgi:hypothetical protein